MLVLARMSRFIQLLSEANSATLPKTGIPAARPGNAVVESNVVIAIAIAKNPIGAKVLAIADFAWLISGLRHKASMTPAPSSHARAGKR
jgi:hypothetical protein